MPRRLQFGVRTLAPAGRSRGLDGTRPALLIPGVRAGRVPRVPEIWFGEARARVPIPPIPPAGSTTWRAHDSEMGDASQFLGRGWRALQQEPSQRRSGTRRAAKKGCHPALPREVRSRWRDGLVGMGLLWTVRGALTPHRPCQFVYDFLVRMVRTCMGPLPRSVFRRGRTRACHRCWVARPTLILA
jgi:hypothetical protein